MITRFAHAGVQHANEIETTAHNNAPMLFLASGVTIALGIAIYWLLTRSDAVTIEEEERE